MLSSLAVGQAQGSPASIVGPPAVDHQGMPVDEAALLRIGQEENRLGDIVRRGKTSHGVYVDDVLVGVVAACLVGYIHFGFDPAGTNSIAAHSVSSPLRCSDARKPN